METTDSLLKRLKYLGIELDLEASLGDLDRVAARFGLRLRTDEECVAVADKTVWIMTAEGYKTVTLADLNDKFANGWPRATNSQPGVWFTRSPDACTACQDKSCSCGCSTCTGKCYKCGKQVDSCYCSAPF